MKSATDLGKEKTHLAKREVGFRFLARRTWDLNPRRFPLPVFKTGALGRYASPPWERLPEKGSWQKFEKTSAY